MTDREPTPENDCNDLESVVAAMWDEYNKDQQCSYKRINQLIEDGAAILRRKMTMEELDALGEAHKDDPSRPSARHYVAPATSGEVATALHTIRPPAPEGREGGEV